MLKPATGTIKRARALRRQLGVPETILWLRLRTRPNGFKFRRQHPAGPYILDFYCAQAKLAVEVDGISHDMGRNPARDTQRDLWLKAQGVAVLRIAAGMVVKNIEIAAGMVVKNIEDAIETIATACANRMKPLHQPAAGPPPRSGEETEERPEKAHVSSPSPLGEGDRAQRGGGAMPADPLHPLTRHAKEEPVEG